MILTQCAVCATDLGLSLGKKCGRCSTRYCGPDCQVQHWERGGHEALCRRIRRAGGAEQYHADIKCNEAVAVAVEACADDTRGQTCYICMEAVHSRTGEGLVRGCACGDRDGVASGRTGIAHVSCLAEQAKILNDEAEENNLALKGRWDRWHTCSLCEQDYHGVVFCALSWACWKTYLGRPETDWPRGAAMMLLGIGLGDAGRFEEALSVQEAELAMRRRAGASAGRILDVQANLAVSYHNLGRLEEASSMQRDVYSGQLKLNGEENRGTLMAANNYAISLTHLKRYAEAKSLLHKMIPVARRVLDESSEITLKMRWKYAEALCRDTAATLDDVREAVTTLEDTERTARRVFGASHPTTTGHEESLRDARAALAARDVEALGDALGALGAA
ncbi:unnamed protein product [Pelagomonas calceolata]|uniref:MYND-type domain-containing protein n=1 Tax=Pelagomonas calceolata TaxID=35677 RepID=A0A8J2SRB8_9STRA|nr:unnamed protein product [Pelagomonas calceolata]